jgi:hypothetical protein
MPLAFATLALSGRFQKNNLGAIGGKTSPRASRASARQSSLGGKTQIIGLR